MDHDSALNLWRQNAQRNSGKNYKFLRSLKYRDYDFDPDETAADLHKQAFQIIDCTRCVNCCKTMTVALTEADIDRISQHLGMSVSEFIDAYLEPDEFETYVIRQRPCPFLGDDDRCSIYDVRPIDCQEYPHTQKPGFATRTRGHADNAERCPAVFWIVEQMRRRARR